MALLSTVGILAASGSGSGSGGGNSGSGSSGSGSGGSGSSGSGSSGSGSSGSGSSGSGSGGGNSGPGNIPSLKTVPVPVPPNLSTYVRDKQALIVLGKALFWDMQTGNDGKQACASCHFHAGADHRRTNQLNGNGGAFEANHMFQPGDFPITSRTVAGSQGVFSRHFNDVSPGNGADDSTSVYDPLYSVGGVSVRRVTGRNTPSALNAVFNVRNFWDGRAKDLFTVFSPFGASDPNSNIVMENSGHLQSTRITIQNDSLASQSVGPPNNPVEMSSDGRTWTKLGKKMLSLSPLGKQKVDPTDSVLGSYAKSGGPGLKPNYTYASLIQAAFYPQYWSSSHLVDGAGLETGHTGISGNTHEYTQMEYNFAMFWGMAIGAYESTLVSDDAPFDRFAGGNNSALSSLEKQGLDVFNGKGNCKTCHAGAEFTNASYTSVKQIGLMQSTGNGNKADTGFIRIGVRPVSEDIGIGGNDGFGVPLSVTPGDTGVAGAFKVPGLRNVEFTGPYFHNGGHSTLEQVVDFYSRGGDFQNDGSFRSSLDARNFSASEKTALVAFLKALSDDRVRKQSAPFDHPQLCVPNGAKYPIQGSNSGPGISNEAMDNMVEIPATGATGGAPLQTFAEMIGAVSYTGQRANDLSRSCPIN